MSVVLQHRTVVSLVLTIFALLLGAAIASVCDIFFSRSRDITSSELLRAPVLTALQELILFWKFPRGKTFALIALILLRICASSINVPLWALVRQEQTFTRSMLGGVNATGCPSASAPFDFQFEAELDETACTTTTGCSLLKSMLGEMNVSKNLTPTAMASAQVELVEAVPFDALRIWNPVLSSVVFQNECTLDIPGLLHCNYSSAVDAIWFGATFLEDAPIIIGYGDSDPGWRRITADLKLLGYLNSEGNSRINALWRYNSTSGLAIGRMSLRLIFFRELLEVPPDRTSRSFVLYSLQGVIPVETKRPFARLMWQRDSEMWSAICTRKGPGNHQYGYKGCTCIVSRSGGHIISGAEKYDEQYEGIPWDVSYSWSAQYKPKDERLVISNVADLEDMFLHWDSDLVPLTKMLSSHIASCTNTTSLRVSGIVQTVKYMVPVAIFGALPVLAIIIVVCQVVMQRIFSEFLVAQGSISRYLESRKDFDAISRKHGVLPEVHDQPTKLIPFVAP